MVNLLYEEIETGPISLKAYVYLKNIYFVHNTNAPVEKTYICPCQDVGRRKRSYTIATALIKFKLRVCMEQRPIALLRVLPRDFPFLPFPFSQDHCFQGDPQNPVRGAKDCYERICGNPRSNLHADDNGCISSLIRRFCRRLLFLQVVFAR